MKIDGLLHPDLAGLAVPGLDSYQLPFGEPRTGAPGVPVGFVGDLGPLPGAPVPDGQTLALPLDFAAPRLVGPGLEDLAPGREGPELGDDFERWVGELEIWENGLSLDAPERPLFGFPGGVIAQDGAGKGGAQGGAGVANAPAGGNGASAPYVLPLPSTPLPGRSRDWTGLALDVLITLQDRGIGGPLIDRLVDSGAVFTVEPLTGADDKGRYSPDDDALKLPPSFFDPSGELSVWSRDRLTTLVHELWHAYRDQVLGGGWDPTTQGVFDRAVQWLGTTTVVAKSGDAKSTVSPFNASGIASAAEFLDEYVGALLNDLVPTWARLYKEVQDGTLTRAEADQSWKRHVARIKAGTGYEAYEDAESPTFEVRGAPPGALVDHLLNLFGMSGF